MIKDLRHTNQSLFSQPRQHENKQSDSVGVIFHKQFEFLMGAIFPDLIFPP